jgi:predicted oxidoreductase
MKYIDIPNTNLHASEISLGMMRISGLTNPEISTLVHTALDEGINFFDHADIYGGGKCEEKFSEALEMNPRLREQMYLQTKCGISRGYYDFSKEHILEAVDGSLKRLRTDYIDVLLLHRPDALVEPEEVADAFNILQGTGKVRFFGVSNQIPMQIELLKKFVSQKLVVNQLQLSITFTGMIDAGINVNTKFDGAIMRDGSILDYCRLNNMTVQPWSPFQYGFFEGAFLDNAKFPELNQTIDRLVKDRKVPNSAIAIAWLLRHPARMQPVVGTTKPERVKEICQASEVNLSRAEWYEIYKAAGNKLP